MKKQTQPEKEIKEITCSSCQNHSEDFCLDFKGNKIPRLEKLAVQPFWMYETCKKNWGLPQNAFYNGNNCKFFKEKK